MKNILQTLSISILFLIGSAQAIYAADLLVVSGGAGGAYASLNAAIAAAAPGDRIIVTPHAGAYTEGTITLNKSLQILSSVEGGQYTIDGNINITPASAGINLTIVGMKLITGSIQSTIASPTGARSSIQILHDSIITGNVSIDHNNYNVTCAASHIQGGVTIRFGKILGNVVNNQIIVNTDGSVNNPTDSVLIIGNRVTMNSSGNIGAISWQSTSQFFTIQNNYILLPFTGNYVNYGIWSGNCKASTAGTNSIFNNTVHKPSGILNWGIVMTTATNSVTEVQNNLVVAAIYNGSLYFAGGLYSVHYNYATNFTFSGATNDGTNIAATNTSLNSDGLVSNPLSNTLNGGNPDAAYDNIDGSRNHAGCYGGSYTLSNFLPLSSSDWARVILLQAPRRVLVNGTINIQATGFDK